MNQRTLFDVGDPLTKAQGQRRQRSRLAYGLWWDRDAPRGTCGAVHFLWHGDTQTNVVVRHCGHPTALNPYLIELYEGGSVRCFSSGLNELKEGDTHATDAYSLLANAKADAQQLYESQMR